MTGALYGLLAAVFPVVRAGRGTLYGAAVWVAADEIVTPALGLARPRHAQSGALQAYSLTGHLVYGCALDTVLDLLHRRLPGRWVERRPDRSRKAMI